MQSWMMKLWLNNHDESKWPDLPIYQPEGACHVTRAEEHPSEEDIQKMCSESFFTSHKYLYIESIQRSVEGTADEGQYEFLSEFLNIPQLIHQGASVPYQPPRESLSTVGLSRNCSSKFGQGQQTVEQGGGEQPSFITSDTRELRTPLPQYGGKDSFADFYSCVDLLVQGPDQGQEDERSSTGPKNSTEIFQDVEYKYKLKCDSNEDIAVQKLLKDAECLYKDIVQGKVKSVREQNRTLLG